MLNTVTHPYYDGILTAHTLAIDHDRKISPRAPPLLLNCCYNPKNAPRHPQTAPVARAGLLPRVRRSSTKETKPPLVITGNRECHQECAITNNRLARQVSTFAAGVSIPPSLALNGPVIQLVVGIKKNVKKPSMDFEQFISSECNYKYANCFQ